MQHYPKTDFQTLLRQIVACPEARDWVGKKSLAEAWATSERPDWMLWLVARMVGQEGWPTHQEVVLAACAVAEAVLPVFEAACPGDTRPRVALATARKWATREASIQTQTNSPTVARQWGLKEELVPKTDTSISPQRAHAQYCHREALDNYYLADQVLVAVLDLQTAHRQAERRYAVSSTSRWEWETDDWDIAQMVARFRRAMEVCETSVRRYERLLEATP